MDLEPLFRATPDAYLVVDPGLRIVAANDRYCALTGASRESMVGRPLFDAFPDNPDDATADGVRNLRSSLQRVLATRLPDQMRVQKYDVRNEAGQFEERYWSPLNTPVLDAEGRVLWIIHRVEEVTSLVKLGLPATALEVEAYAHRANAALASVEEQLRHAQKLEAIGRLAGGVAHDFNNLLSVILSGVEFIRADIELPEGPTADLTEIERAAQRAAELTRRLLAFSRQQVLDPKVISPAAVVRGLHPMLTRLLGEDVEQRLKIDDAAGSILADSSQLEQVLMNLAVNSRDAMPTGGLLGIEVSRAELSEEYASTHPEVPAGRYVQITVSDTGSGMDPATRARAFEPFFTTKPAGQGTGLGLSTVFGIVRQSGGFIWLYSEPGIGTTFKLYFPVVETAPTPVPTARPEALTGKGEVVLVIEDDDAVRHAVVRILERLGYAAEGTGSIPEALARCATGVNPPALVVSDIVMPEMGGGDLAERIGALVPGVRVLYMSGYTDDVVMQHGILARGVPFLSKPITIEALGRKVREVLGS
jgi:PAS domain S-box-containing protein